MAGRHNMPSFPNVIFPNGRSVSYRVTQTCRVFPSRILFGCHGDGFLVHASMVKIALPTTDREVELILGMMQLIKEYQLLESMSTVAMKCG
jgi:hypothetical protein